MNFANKGIKNPVNLIKNITDIEVKRQNFILNCLMNLKNIFNFACNIVIVLFSS
jgi:hypothetical protein